jgi:hypothetical protein
MATDIRCRTSALFCKAASHRFLVASIARGRKRIRSSAAFAGEVQPCGMPFARGVDFGDVGRAGFTGTSSTSTGFG